MKIAVGSKTDVGRARDMNQDSYLVEDPIFVVADGMGGHLAGDVASRTAIEKIVEMAGQKSPGQPGALRSYVSEANRAIWSKGKEDPNLAGMGTTCTLIYLDGGIAHFAHVGDSRAYRLRGTQLEQLTEDHTLVERMVQEGRLRREDAPRHPQRSIITRALGVDQTVDVDEFDEALRDDDRLLICSDGLSSMLDDAKIASILSEQADPQSAADALVDAANEAGGEDNITVIVIDVKSGGSNDAVAATAAAPERQDTPLTSSPPAPEAPAAPPPLPDASDENDDGAPRSRVGRKVVIGVIIALLFGGAAYAAARYALDNSWFVGANDDGNVTIYKGIPDEIAGLDLRDEQEVTDVHVDDLPDFLQGNVEDGIKVSSLDEARETVANLEDRSEDFQQPEPEKTGDGKKREGNS
jgi:PPM family protein phosphatase